MSPVVEWVLFICAGCGVTAVSATGVSLLHSRKPSRMIRYPHKPPVRAGDTPGSEVAKHEPAPVYEQYGHPWAPFPMLKAALPKPPSGYAWEISANINGFGNAALRLGMQSLLTDEITDYAERDMVVIRRWQYADDDTFAAFYRRAVDVAGNAMAVSQSGRPIMKPDTAKAMKLAEQIFLTHLISPLSDWAVAEVARKAVSSPMAALNGTTNYELVGA